MSTSATIKVHNVAPGRSFNVMVSHDGTPDFVLKVLASFFSSGELTQESFKQSYLSNYDHESRKNVTLSFTRTFGADWEYHITKEGTLSVKCTNNANKQIMSGWTIDPLLYLTQVANEYKEEVRSDILSSLNTLYTHGVALKFLTMEDVVESQLGALADLCPSVETPSASGSIQEIALNFPLTQYKGQPVPGEHTAQLVLTLLIAPHPTIKHAFLFSSQSRWCTDGQMPSSDQYMYFTRQTAFDDVIRFAQQSIALWTIPERQSILSSQKAALQRTFDQMMLIMKRCSLS